jgi:hypothetical protein
VKLAENLNDHPVHGACIRSFSTLVVDVMLQDLRNKWEAQAIGILECTTNIQSMYLSSTTYSHQLSPIIKANLAYLHTIHFVLDDDGLESLKMLNQFPALMHLKISF